MSSDQQLAEYEQFEALLDQYYIELYEECFYTDEAWEILIADAENEASHSDSEQLAEYERFEALFDQYCQEQWLWFCAQQRAK